MNLNTTVINLAKWRPRTIMALTCMALSTLNPAIAAIESNETPPAIGRMPVLPALTLPVGSIAPEAAATGATEPVSDHAKVGVPLTLADMGIDWSTYVKDNFIDEDNDAESGSFYEWLIDGVVVSNASTYTPTSADGGQSLSVRITPKTASGDPELGSKVVSNSIVIYSSVIDGFIKSDNGVYNFHDAENYCSNTMGGRLPSVNELKALYQQMTDAIVTGNNYQMCTRYGWPLTGVCGGNTGVYWSNELNSGGEYLTVSLGTGNTYSHDISHTIHVACVL